VPLCVLNCWMLKEQVADVRLTTTPADSPQSTNQNAWLVM